MAWLLDRQIRRELPPEWGGIVPTEAFIREATRVIEEGEEKGVKLRMMGGLAILVHSGEYKVLASKLGRAGMGVARGQEFSDIDLITYGRFKKGVERLFSELNYARRKATLSTAASQRQIYYHPKGWFTVDVFYDKLLVANHPLNFKGRLELDYPTITPTDLLLEKVQMWEAFGQKDLKDCLILLRSHSMVEGDAKDAIDKKYIAKLLAGDWGLWYTATSNLKKIREFTIRIDELGKEAEIDPKVLTEEDRKIITGRVDELLERVNEEPKTLKWRLRSKIGTKARWYEPVERPDTVGGFGIWEAILK
jgi:hypothetical protein